MDSWARSWEPWVRILGADWLCSPGHAVYFSELVILCAIETIPYVGALEMLAPSFPPGERNLFCPGGPAQDGIKHLLDML